MKMDDKDFNIDDIINDVNSKMNQKKASQISEADDISFRKESDDSENKLPEISINNSVSDNDTVSEEISSDSIDASDADEKSDDLIESDSQNQDEIRPEDQDDKQTKPEMSDLKSEYIARHTADVKKNKPTKKKKRNKKKKKTFNTSIFGGLILVTVILVISLVVAIGGISWGLEYTGMGKSENQITFNIPKNSSTDDIAQILIDNQIIENKTLFKITMRLKNPQTIYPGDITLHPSMGYAAIIDELAKMRENYETVTITFQEGLTLLDVANMLQENQVCTAEDFLFEFNKLQGYDFESKLDTNADSFYKMEGFFFPDTYEFYVDDTAYNVTKIIRQHFEEKFTDSMYKKMKEKKLTLNEVMTLASLVQWEANSSADMPKVASVFLNRLDDPDTFPSLQSDATKKYITKVIDVMADNDASIEHYTDSYDTYECQGLPAGPICNPGIDAINAVLNPEDTNYYYFCNNLETGKSYFAETLEEHEKNLKKAGLT